MMVDVDQRHWLDHNQACAPTAVSHEEAHAHASQSYPPRCRCRRRRSFGSLSSEFSRSTNASAATSSDSVSTPLLPSTPESRICRSSFGQGPTIFRPRTSGQSVDQPLIQQVASGSVQRKASHQVASTCVACACIPYRRSSLHTARKNSQGTMSTAKRQRGNANILPGRGRKDRHFTSIDELLTSSSSASSSISDLHLGLLRSNTLPSSTLSRSKPSSKVSSTSSSPSSLPQRASLSSSRPPARQRRRSSLPETYIQVHTTTPPSPPSPQRQHSHPSRPPLTPNPPSLINLPLPLPLPAPDSTSDMSPGRKRPSLAPQTLTWTSNETRRLEYAAIDRAHSGVRGFLRRILPPSCFTDEYRRFWDEDDRYGGKAGNEEENEEEDGDSDARSVRRYRLRLDGESEDGLANEKAGEVVADTRSKRRLPWASMRTWT